MNTGAYTRYIFGANYVQSFGAVNNVADEAYNIQVFDGLGRVVAAAGNHPGSNGGYRAQLTSYDLMGRAVKTSNPAEITGTWLAIGDDAAGWLYTEQTYDWQGRPLRTTHPDTTYKEASYSGCGCAGGEVVTLTDEGTVDAGVAKRRQQRIYSDVLGRTVKTELLNWQGGSVYSTTVNIYNARDQITQVRQYAGAEGSSTYQDTTMTYDGYGRLKTRHVPEENVGTGTTWTYNQDNSLNTVTDARGAITTFGYAGTNRHLVKTITHTLSGSPQINVSYNYDAVGNRTSMNDSLGTVDYGYDQLSRLTSEIRTLSGVGSFALSYSYNLAGQLASFSSFGHSISYTRDATGRLTAVSGSPFGGVTQYVSNIKYRAWGARKQVSYSNNNTASTQYNSRLLPISYSLSNVMTRSYFYFADGRLKSSSLVEDGSFNRAYEYDHVGRLKSDTTPNNFAQNLTYDVWGNATQSAGWHWSRFIGFAGTYTNNRNTDWQYNAAGQVTFNGDNAFAYDAAGRISQIWTQGGVMNGGQMDYDGDGQFVHNTSSSIYNVRSTVFSGAVVAEVLANGQRSRGFIYGEGAELVAMQYDGTNHVVWEHRDEGGQGVRLAQSAGGAVESWEETSSGAKIEPEDPYPTDPDFTGADTDGRYPHLGTVGKAITGCARDGIPLPDCSWIFVRVHHLELMEANARAEFLGYSVSTAHGSKKFGNDFQRAIGEAYEQGHLTVTANWRVNENWFQVPHLFSMQAQSQNPQKTGQTKPPCPPVPDAPSDANVDSNIRIAAANFKDALEPKWYAGPDSGEYPLGKLAGHAMWFFNQVKDKGPWDYKYRDPAINEGRRSRYETFGNFNYGAAGVAAGFSEGQLLRLAGYYQTDKIYAEGTNPGMLHSILAVGGRAPYGDEPGDQDQIRNGINYYRRKFVLKDCE